VLNFIKKEIADFHQISQTAREILRINLINSITSIVSGIFVTAYLWSKVSNIKMLVIYHLSMFIILPFAFYTNGILLKYINIIKLHVSGVFISLLTVVLLMFTDTITNYHIIFAGIGMGIGLAFYWANRVYLTQIGVQNNERDIFNALGAALGTLPNIILPTIIGYFLVFGETSGMYSKDLAYKILGLTTVLLGFVLYEYAKKININNPIISKFKTQNKSYIYIYFKLFIFIEGLAGGTMFFIPSALILKYAGKENVLGTTLTISSIIAAIMVYSIGKKIKANKRTYARVISIIILLILAANIAINPGANSIILYTVLSSLTAPILSSIFFTLHQLSIDKLQQNKNDIYPYILATEIYLNIGRITGILILITLYYFYGESVAITNIVFISIALLLFSIIPVEKLNKIVSIND